MSNMFSLYNKYISLPCSSSGVFPRFNKTVQHISFFSVSVHISIQMYVPKYVDSSRKNFNLVVVISDEMKES